MVNKKEIILSLVIGLIFYILSICCGVIFGTIALCVGTVILYKRTNSFWKYSLVTLGLNFILAIVAGICLVNEFNILNWSIVSELEKVLAIFAVPMVYMLGIVVSVVIMGVALIRFGLQCLCCFICKKSKDRSRNNIISNSRDDYNNR